MAEDFVFRRQGLEFQGLGFKVFKRVQMVVPFAGLYNLDVHMSTMPAM